MSSSEEKISTSIKSRRPEVSTKQQHSSNFHEKMDSSIEMIEFIDPSSTPRTFTDFDQTYYNCTYIHSCAGYIEIFKVHETRRTRFQTSRLCKREKEPHGSTKENKKKRCQLRFIAVSTLLILFFGRIPLPFLRKFIPNRYE